MRQALRHRIHVFGSLAYLRAPLALQLWSALLVWLAVVLIEAGRALREDRILAEAFGPEYVTYRGKAGSCRHRQKTSPTQIPRALRMA